MGNLGETVKKLNEDASPRGYSVDYDSSIERYFVWRNASIVHDAKTSDEVYSYLKDKPIVGGK